MKNNLEFEIAYSQVLEILKYMPKSDVEKIPKDVLEAMQKSKRFDYKFKYDVEKTLSEQNVSKVAKTILAVFYRDYFASDEVRNIILKKEEFDRKRI